MNNRIMLTIAAVVAAAGASAAPLTPDAALSRALKTEGRRAVSSAADYKLTKTLSQGEANALYVFERGADTGFLVVSADDSTPALLGFGEGKFADENGNIAPECAYWLDRLAQQVAYSATLPPCDIKRMPRRERESIEPLCTTKWSQSWPYNNKCPLQNGSRCVTGCAATSMSQVMKYHNWPITGEGSNSYTWNGRNLRLNFERVTFDWDNMVDDYYSVSTTSEQQDAVATLMQAVGYAINMNYSPSGSGATAFPMGNAFTQNFKYSKSTRYVERAWFSLYDWEELIYGSIEKDAPVVYNGWASDGGHSFVCDGYRGNGYFHINWGWGGMSDGYFLLDVLDPDEQGTGGASAGFNYGQLCFIDILPDREGDSAPFYQLGVYNGNLQMQLNGKTMKIGGFIYNCGCIPIPAGEFGLAYTPCTKFGGVAGETIYIGYGFGEDNDDESEEEPLKVGYGFTDLDFDISELPEGRYLVKPYFKTPEGEIKEIMSPIDSTSEYIVQITGSKVTMKPVVNSIPKMSDVQFPAVFDSENPLTITGMLTNSVNADQNVNVKIMVLSDDLNTQYASTDWIGIPMEADVTQEFELSEMMKSYSKLEAGETYKVAVIMNDGASGGIILAGPADMTYTGGSGVNAVDVENISGPRVYYNAQGIKVAEAPAGEPAPDLPTGIYIVRCGTHTAKIAK